MLTVKLFYRYVSTILRAGVFYSLPLELDHAQVRFTDSSLELAREKL